MQLLAQYVLIRPEKVRRSWILGALLHRQLKGRCFRRGRRDRTSVKGRRCDGEAAGRGERGDVYVEPLAGEELYCLVRLLDVLIF